MAGLRQRRLQPADTPPESPTSVLANLRLVNTPPYQQSSQTLLDDTCLPDFDFQRRLESPGPRKLKKLNRPSNPKSSPYDMLTTSDDHARSSSLESDTGSIKKRISSLLGTSNLHKSNSGRSTNSKVESTIETEDDPLPDTKKELEVRLNHHLAELDMLKRTVQAANEVICQHRERCEIMQTRTTSDMQNFMRRQRQMVKQARANRDSYVTFVSFHLHQLERIKMKRVDIEKEAGLEPTLPQVYRSMWTEQDWQLLFQV